MQTPVSLNRSAARLVTALGFGLVATLAHAQATPAGLWKTIDDDTKKEKSLVRITESGGVFSGRIEKLIDSTMTEKNPLCDKCSGDLKDKPIVGLTIIKGIRQDENDKAIWDGGEILDPNNGKTYKARLTPTDGGKTLAVRGYIGTPMLGRTQTWIRVE